jgi:hypothetical protein
MYGCPPALVHGFTRLWHNMCRFQYVAIAEQAYFALIGDVPLSEVCYMLSLPCY